MLAEPQPQKIPQLFFRTAAGSEPVREWPKGLPTAERQAIGEDLLRAQWRWAVGGGDAAVPPLGARVMGSADRLADKAEGACPALPLRRAPRRPARLHQEDAANA